MEQRNIRLYKRPHQSARFHDARKDESLCYILFMPPHRDSLTVAGLFAGIGGIELGLSRAGHRTQLLCDIDPAARRVLATHFAKAEILSDIRTLGPLPNVDLLTAGFPCQDLSQAGRTAGIAGHQSGLVAEVFQRLRGRSKGPRWLLLENVPFMLQLQGGQAMQYLVGQLERLGFTWAYRIVDARAFGVPQRRRRVLLLASRTEDPRPVLFGCDADEHVPTFSTDLLCGFYWTEGLRGLGWAVDATPTLKGGSSIGIPSPPAIWDPADGSIGTPDIRDAERLQGFDANWTSPALQVPGVRPGHRWKLVGNAVSVGVAAWIGEQLASHPDRQFATGPSIQPARGWPKAAWGHAGKVHAVDVSAWPVRRVPSSLREYLQFPTAPLSYRAAAGFLGRARSSSLAFQPGFLNDVARHADRMHRASVAA
jgi:DNA (cytosine-5)-methyltransferase 1